MFVLCGCDPGKKPLPPPKVSNHHTTLQLDVPPSSITLPVRIPLGELQEAINRKLPRAVVKGEKVKGGFKLEIERDGALLLSGTGKTLKWTLPLHITLKRPRGDNDVVSLTIQPELESVIGLNADYTLRSSTRLTHIHWIDSANLRLAGLNIDITKLVERRIEERAPKLCKRIDKQLEKVSVDKLLERTWTKLNNPIRLNRKVQPIYLLGEPEKAIFHDYHLSRSDLVIHLTLVAGLQTVFDSSANVDNDPSFPPLQIDTAQPEHTHMYLPVAIPYKQINALLAANLYGRQVEVQGQKVVIDSLLVSGQDSFILLDAKFSGDWEAKMQVLGRPYFDAERQVISVRGFEYNVDEGSSSLFHTTDYLFHDDIRDMVLERLYFPAGRLIDSLPQIIYSAIERGKSGSKINLHSEVDEAGIHQLLVEETGIGVVIEARGKLWLEIEDIAPPLPPTAAR